jgi:DNA-binding CsgD family transcriptional regulator
VSQSNGTPEFERRQMALLSPLPLRGNQRARTTDGQARTSDPALTTRQRQVLERLIRGLTNKEIAAELGVGPDAVKRLVSRLLIKLDVPSRAALVRPALLTDAARRRRSHYPNALSVLDAAPIPALVTRGSAHRIEYANPMARKIVHEAGSGTPLANAIPQSSRRAVERVADESFASGAPRVARAVRLDDAARVGWRRVDVFVTPMYDGVQELAGLIVFFVDVSNDPPIMQTSPASDSSRPERARPA